MRLLCRVLAIVIAAGIFSNARAQEAEPWQLPDGPGCIEQWISYFSQVVNAHNGSAEFNSRKPWSINRYGLFVGQGISSNYEPDNWVQFSASKYHWMWGEYRSEEQYPYWRNANFRAAGLKGLRWFVRNCVGGGGSSSGAGGSPSGTGTPSGGTGAPSGGGGACLPGCNAAGLAPDPSAACPSSFGMHSGSTLTLICYCAPGTLTAQVWGTGIYTYDSSLCNAARHAGAISSAGGMIQVQGAPGRSTYQGTASNGITSGSYGPYAWSFLFPGNAPGSAGTTSASATSCPRTMAEHRGTDDIVTCHCEPGVVPGVVWGTDVYTDDSHLCAAALHAGVVGTAGGTIRAAASPGRTAYTGSSRHGVTSASYHQWHGSFYFPR